MDGWMDGWMDMCVFEFSIFNIYILMFIYLFLTYS